MPRTALPPITTQIISCIILNTSDHNPRDSPGPEAILNSSLLSIKCSTCFFFFFQNNAYTRNCAVWMDTQVTCCVRSSTGNLDFIDPNPINSKYVTFLNTGNVEVLLDMLIEVYKRPQSNNYFQTAFIIVKTILLQYLSHLLLTMASTVNIIHLSLMRKLSYLCSDSLGGPWKLGTASTTSHQEEQVLSIAWVVLVMGSSCTCPAASGASERGLLSQCYIRACAHWYPCTGELSWVCIVPKKKKKRSQNCRHLSDSAVHMHYNFFPFTRALLYISAEAGQRAAPLHHSVCSPVCFLLGKQKSQRTKYYCSALVLRDLREE